MDRLTKLATAYWSSAALNAAIRLDLFAVLGEPGKTADEAAEALGTAPRPTRALLNALTGLGLLVCTDGRYRLEPSAAQFLGPSASFPLQDALRFNMDLYPLWGQLGETVRTDRPVLPPSAHLGADPERTKRFVLGMHSRALATVPALLPALDMAGVTKLLDLAAGAGTFSVQLASKHPELTATVFDLPSVLEVARDLIRQTPLLPRIGFLAGDYRQDPLPEPFDAVLFCGALHQENEDSAAAILRKIWKALRPGGRVFVVDFFVNADGASPVFSALFALNMMLVSPTAHVFSEQEICRLLQATGFAAIRFQRPPGSHYGVATGQKPV